MFLNNYHYIIKLYIGVTTSISSSLSIYALTNAAQFLNFTFLFALFVVAAAAECLQLL